MNPYCFRIWQNYSVKRHYKFAKGSNMMLILKPEMMLAISEYIKMIDYKTAVLIGAAMKMGAIVGGAS